MTDYQPFPISNFRTGFDQSVEPWLLPREAFQTMVNAHLYRGVLEKIEGYELFATFSYGKTLVLTPAPDGVTKTFTGVLPTQPTSNSFLGYGTIVSGVNAETFTYQNDASATVINLIGSAGGTGTLNLSTLVVSLTFNTAPPNNIYSTVFFRWDSFPATGACAIMGIKPYYQQAGGRDIIVFDQRRAGKVIPISGTIASTQKALQSIQEIPSDYYQSALFTGNGVLVTFTGTLAGFPFIPGTLRWNQYFGTAPNIGKKVTGLNVNDVTDNGQGGLIGTGVSSGSINYMTGAYTITFSVAPANTNYFDSTTGKYKDIFTGTISNFISLYNYQNYAFFSNNKDPIYYYDGTAIHYLNTSTSVQAVVATAGVPTNLTLKTCLHVFVNRERLLIIAPIVDTFGAQYSTIYWAEAGAPLNFTENNFLQASTSQSIKAIGFINSDLVVRFSNSERVFRYTADAFDPFRWDSTNNLWACDAPYSSINYDSSFSSVGRPAIVTSDGVNVKRADEIIPDFTDQTKLAQQTPVPFMNQTSIQQCYGERFDDIKEGWLCYNSFPINQSIVTASDYVLAYNYLDGTYATYTFPLSCLGLGNVVNVPTWATTFTTWAETTDTWDSYQVTSDALLDLGGDQFDSVYELNSSSIIGQPLSDVSPPSPVLMSVITKNFNPFIEDGQLCRFGYVDIFVSAYQLTKLRVQFYLDDNLYIDANNEPQGWYQETLLTFTPTDAMSPTQLQTKVWKRIYVGSVGKSHTIRFYQKESDFTQEILDQPVLIHSFVPYFKPAGRIFN